jgi:hypothetical protein
MGLGARFHNSLVFPNLIVALRLSAFSADKVPPASGIHLFILSICWFTASACIRISLLVLYYRLMRHIGIQRYRWVLHCALLFVIGILLSYLGAMIFSCM